jgi:hypothetical protein
MTGDAVREDRTARCLVAATADLAALRAGVGGCARRRAGDRERVRLYAEQMLAAGTDAR